MALSLAGFSQRKSAPTELSACILLTKYLELRTLFRVRSVGER